jgi:hypothetical protein
MGQSSIFMLAQYGIRRKFKKRAATFAIAALV